MKRILALTDLSSVANFGILSAFRLAKKTSAQLHILHADEDGIHLKASLRDSSNFPTQLKNKELSSAIKRWINLAHSYEIEASFELMDGPFSNALDTVLLENPYDLLIMGGTGIGHSKEFWGSTTELVIKKANLPVLVVKQEIENEAFKKVIFASSFDQKDQEAFKIMLKLIPFSKDASCYLLAINIESYYLQPAALVEEAMNDFIVIASPIHCIKKFYRDYNVNAGIRHYAEEIIPDLIVMSDKHKKPIKHLLLGHEAVKVASISRFPVLVIDY